MTMLIDVLSFTTLFNFQTIKQIIHQSRSKMSISMNMKPRNFCKSLFIVTCGIYICASVNAQIIIPSQLDGFWYRNQSLKSDSIFIEAFLDPVCPDSRDSWPPLKQALEYYGSQISLLVHPFPLPYHDNAFVCSRALHIVDKLSSDHTVAYVLLEAFFTHQERFYGAATFNLSRASIVDQIVEFAAEQTGFFNSSAIQQGFDDSTTDLATRSSFKYGCVKGVYGTPFFFVNGFPLPNAGDAIDYNGWKKILDPLVNKKGFY